MKTHRSTYEALSLDTFVAFDVETTGLDPVHDEILEVGMVRMKKGDVDERYSQLFCPSVPIPLSVTQLTGIQSEDCENRPSLKEKFSEIVAFLGDDWIVAHNAGFDLGFLQAAWRNFLPEASPPAGSRILDTLELSRLLLPWLPNHRLESVAEHLHIPFKRTHRALADAETTAFIFRGLLPLAVGLDYRTLALICRILSGVSDGLRFFFENVSHVVEQRRIRQNVRSRKGPNNVLGREAKPADTSQDNALEEKEIDRYFQPGGILSGVLPRYEYRKPQNAMSQWVRNAFNANAFLIAEAGAGVGKSLAYAVATVLWITQNGGCRAVISTHTKTLQDQLFTKELPLLARVCKDPFLAVLLKGRSNYICLRRWQHLISHVEEKLSSAQRKKLLPLVVWLCETQTGDIEENAGFGRDKNSDIWFQLNSEGSQCLKHRCEFESVCFFQKIRRASRLANIVVVNHSLLFSDIAAGYSVLGDYDTLVIDEAHQVERVATQCLGIKFHLGLFQELSHRLDASGTGEAEMLVPFQQFVRKTVKNKKRREALERHLRKTKRFSHELVKAAFSFFQAAGIFFSQRAVSASGYSKIRIRESGEIARQVTSEEKVLENALAQTETEISRFLSLLGEIEEDVSFMEEGKQALESILVRIADLQKRLVHFCKDAYVNEIVWCEMPWKGEKHDIVFYSVPMDIADVLAESLYPKLKRCVLTSATLSVAGRFDYFLSRLGMDHVEAERVMTHEFGSPYCYSEQVLLLVPTFLSNPNEKTFSKDVSDLLKRVVSVHSRGTMVLFTSHKLLREVYHTLLPSLKQKGVRLLGQGLDGSPTSLLKIFQENERSLLLGTSSFWEGVDVPGSALELLVISKIPFDVPTEPVIEARMEQVHARTGNGFFNFAVPEAIVKFRQGFGRLIRSGEDKGAILLLDHRIVQTRYGMLFLESLPLKATICNAEEMLIERLEKWFA